MHDLIRTLPLALLLALAGPAVAQEATGTPEATEEATPDPLELNMGQTAEEGPGSIYEKSVHDDWQIRCIRTEGGEDPCQLYQLLSDENGNPVSEINIFPLGEAGGDAVAGATVVTPLETLLTAQLALSVDTSGFKKYPFSWCSQIGCFARLGFTQADVDTFKAGNSATVVIVPVAAPDQRVTLAISLKGFTAAYEEALELATAAQ
ncbi:invasion associated locus B family protein [Pseudoruegeria sp. HB172150]|uniref:invasion associated locus B family protein n=1 Tax=Pseudoruegeria sp. HB172150 TaxID=2721164 RepID=UPI001555A82C|nr:invasion associated locus B family protein [Pseudoruegeria sp. HB172150]